jgi:rod shape determining protein RodA
MAFDSSTGRRGELSARRKLLELNWFLVLLLCIVAGIGFAMLYSAAGGKLDPWASRQMIRFAIGVGLMVVLALVDLRFWLRYAYFAYFVSLLLLIAVELMGFIGMGAQRWLDLGLFQLQPSEVMKIALVLALARYYHGLTMDDVPRFRSAIVPLALIGAPLVLLLRQPDLGTAVLLTATGAAMVFAAGERIWKFILAFAGVVAAVPLAWKFMLREYQQQRVLTFLEPERDPLGAGYHISQSKIALGSGSVFGKGFSQGTQSQLSFLPERHTDFIFAMLAEEFGLVGSLSLLGFYVLVIIYGVVIAVTCRSHFGRLLAIGIITTFFLYVFINMAMVMGLVPVVGVPLPLVSYGGTSMMSLMMGFGLILCVSIHRELVIPRNLRGFD